MLEPIKRKLANKLCEMRKALQSSISYAVDHDTRLAGLPPASPARLTSSVQCPNRHRHQCPDLQTCLPIHP